MKKALSILFMLPLTIWTYGQADKGIKVYTNYFSDSYSVSGTIDDEIVTESRSLNTVGTLSAGYIWKNSERRWSELEFGFTFESAEFLREVRPVGQANSQLRVSETVNSTLFSSRYEWQYQLFGNERVTFNLGPSVQLYWLNNQFKPQVTSFFPHYSNKVWSRVAAVPRVLFHFERFALDINLPITVMHGGFSLTRVENSTIPPEERSVSGFDFDLLPNEHWLQARVGIWWYL